MNARSTLILLSACATLTAAAAQAPASDAVPFIDNDYALALKQAKQKKLPLFVDAWTPWCHTCRSMRAFVFSDPALAKHAGRFVWLSMDTERPDAVKFLEKNPISLWPTLLVIDPAKERAVLKWQGAATLEQLEKLLDDGERGFKGKGQGLEAKLDAADQAFAAARFDDAAKLYAELCGSAPKEWERRPRAVETWMSSLYHLKDRTKCAEIASRELDAVPRGTSWASIVTNGLGCALELPEEDASRSALIKRFEPLAADVVQKRDVTLAADDYSALFELVIDARENLKDEAGAKAMAEAWTAYLEGVAEKAPNAEARTVFDGHRLTAYLKIHQPQKAAAMLEASEKALPYDYNPPARLAIAYRELGRYDEALAAIERALAKVHGPRKLRILSTKADIFAKKGDVAQAKKVLNEGLAFVTALPKPQQPKTAMAAIQKQLDALK